MFYPHKVCVTLFSDVCVSEKSNGIVNRRLNFKSYAIDEIKIIPEEKSQSTTHNFLNRTFLYATIRKRHEFQNRNEEHLFVV